LDKHPATQWSNKLHWRFKNPQKIFGAPWLDDVIDSIESGAIFEATKEVSPPPPPPVDEEVAPGETKTSTRSSSSISSSSEKVEIEIGPSYPPPPPSRVLPDWLKEFKEKYGWKQVEKTPPPPPTSKTTTKSPVDYHNSLCQTCGFGGDLLCCDFCNLVYHEKCLPMDEIIPNEPEKWACPACRE
jgi:hypothetical protein